MMMVVTTILAIVFVSYLQSKKVRNTAQWVSRTSEVLYNSETILATVMNNVTDARGYALTGSDQFLGSLQKSGITLTTKLAALKELTADNAAQQQKIDSIAAYISKRVEFSNRIVAARNEKGLAGASDLSITGEGTLYVERIRQLMYELQATETLLLQQRKNKNERAFTQLNSVLIILGLLVLVLVIITYLAGKELLLAEKQLANQQVKSNQELLEVAEEQAGLGSWELEVVTKKGMWSKEMFRLFGFQIKEEVPDFDQYLERIHPDDRPQVLQALSNMQEGKEPVSKNYRTNPEILPLRHLKPTWRLEKDKHGNPFKFSGTLLDITGLVDAEHKIIKANRLYFFISQINQMIVRVNDEKTLFEEACRIAVDIGKFRMAWIGMVNEETKQVVPVMHAGEERNYLTKIKTISIADVPEGNGPTGKALREGRYIVCNDIESDAQMAPWKEPALARGYLSSMALPIKRFGKVIGAFSFYASEKNYFDKEEIALLEEATGDVSFALEVHEKERLRKQAEEELLKEKKLSDSIINSLPGIFYLYTKEGKFLRWNKNFEQVSRYSGEEIMEMHPLDFFDENDKELLTQKIANTFIVGEENVQSDFLLKTKQKIPYYFTGKAIEYEDSICLMGVGIDFTERVRAQEIIKDTTLKLRQLTAHLQNIREEERKRIGREIHDELGQQLTAIKMDISWIDKKIIDETGIIKNKLKNIIGLLDGSNQSIRRILSELRPGLLDERGLIEALKWLGRQFTDNTGLTVLFSSTETEIRLAEPQATCIFRVYQEALTNIMRYAKANKVSASLNIVNGDVVVTISDDGQGFSPEALQRKPTFGILGMKERVASLNGNFELESAPGRGTKVTFSIPYHEGSLS